MRLNAAFVVLSACASGKGTSADRGTTGGAAGGGGAVVAGASGAGGTVSPACVPGKQDACACPGGTQGVQSCKDDGSGYAVCACPGGTGGAAGASGSGGAGGGKCPFAPCLPTEHCAAGVCEPDNPGTGGAGAGGDAGGSAAAGAGVGGSGAGNGNAGTGAGAAPAECASIFCGTYTPPNGPTVDCGTCNAGYERVPYPGPDMNTYCCAPQACTLTCPKFVSSGLVGRSGGGAAESRRSLSLAWVSRLRRRAAPAAGRRGGSDRAGAARATRAA